MSDWWHDAQEHEHYTVARYLNKYYKNDTTNALQDALPHDCNIEPDPKKKNHKKYTEAFLKRKVELKTWWKSYEWTHYQQRAIIVSTIPNEDSQLFSKLIDLRKW